MKNYLLTLLFVSALTGGVVYLSTGSSYEKHLRYLSTLLILLALLSPLPSLFSSFGAVSVPEVTDPAVLSSEYGSLLRDRTEQRLNDELTYRISSLCNLTKDDFSLSCHIELDEEKAVLTLQSITVKLFTLDSTVQREEIRRELLAVCPVIYFQEEIGKKGREAEHE